MMTDLKTNSSLLQKLENAAGKTLSAHELHQQRVSFIIGSLSSKSDCTRADVEKVLRQIEGPKAA